MSARVGGRRFFDVAALLDFSKLDWLVAWRHLRTGDERPTWVVPLMIAALYLVSVGGGLALYATSLEGGSGPVVVGPFDVPGTDSGPTPLQGFYGAFGVLTLLIGVMFLIFALLSWFFNLLPTIITMSVLLGCMALVVVLSLMSGLEGDLRDKILAQKAHVRVARADGRPFEDYRALADALAAGDGLAGASPYLEGEIMVRSGLNRQGAILGGIIPSRQTTVSNLRDLVRKGSYDYLEHPERIPDPDPFVMNDDGDTPWRLRHLDEQRKKRNKKEDRSFEAQTRRVTDDGKPDTGKTTTEPAADDDGPDDDDGPWEDPSAILGGTGELGEDVGGGTASDGGDGDGDDDDDGADGEVVPGATGLGGAKGPGSGLLGKLPPPPPRSKMLGEVPDADALDEADGWEDPTKEIEQLREQGLVPDAPEGGDDGDEGGDEGGGGDGEPDDLGIVGAAEAESIFPILIGKELSAELGVGEGAQLQLITPIGRMTPAGRVPGQLVTKVAGVFFSGMYEYDRKNVYAPLEVVQRFLLVGDRVTGIEVKLADVDDIDAGKAEVERVVAQMGRDEELLVEDWRDLNRNLFSAMFLEKVAMFIALLFVVLVASFGILASNLMSVMEKAKEIAILKAMGTADAGIMRVFIAEGLCVGMLGSFGGIGMGLVLCGLLDRFGLPLNENVYYIEKLPVVVNPAEVALVGVAALIIVCFSSLYPALVASRLRPVDGLRHGD